MPESKDISKGQEKLSRMKLLDGKRPPLPPIDGYTYMVECLFEVGPVDNSGMGPGAVSWREIESWADLCQHQLTPWEATTIRDMSAAYADEAGTASSPTAPPPWVEIPSEEKRERTAAHIRSVLRG